MNFDKYSALAGKHAFLGASQYHWLNYDEEKLATVSSVTSLMAEGKTPEDILGIILGDVGLEILDRMPVGFKCDCSREKVKDALALVSREEMAQIIADNKPIEVVCHFCNTSYNFDVQELKMID